MVSPQEAGYKLSDQPVYEDDQLARYATEDPTIFVEIFVPPEDSSTGVDPRLQFSMSVPPSGQQGPDFSRYIDLYEALRGRLLEAGLEAYIPEVLEYDIEDHWVAFGVEPGLYSLESVRSSFPNGINGRDWAWMTTRILRVLREGGRRNNLVEENLLVHPEGHGVVLLGWQPVEDPDVYPLDQLKDLMEKHMLKSVDGLQQIDLLGKLSSAFKENRIGQENLKLNADRQLFGYGMALRDYKLKLVRLYGPDSFHELVVDRDFSIGYLEDESKLVRDRGEL